MGCLRQNLAVAAVLAIPSNGSASTVELSEIVSIDELGYECISGEHFEEVDELASVAFSVGKKIRLPRTCLPDPCEGALTERELSNITGTEMIYPRFRDEWNEYYARYADHCRKETVTTVAGTIVPQEEFWVPLRQNPTSSSPTPPPRFPTTPVVFGKDPKTDGEVSPSVEQVSEVPLPASWLMLAGAVALLARRKRA